ncbi:hypothetical protein Ahy_B08g089503 isoform D [Arachis hypogaea]|uniref:Uncharacterized protein n=1 Tax=Arachis hypogaea TaxID=3818 RepID=A0A444XY30_ARAHY|nr:hypothetical protein Ahy_B08g089503 isoform D [Arachis hypogaea]
MDMATAPATHCSFGIRIHSHAASSSCFPNRLDCSSSSHFPLHLELSTISIFPRSSSPLKGSMDRVCARPDIDDFYWEKVSTPILDTIENPICLKNLSLKELKQLAGELRLELSSIMSSTQISLSASIAAVELTIAMHHVFHAPVDKILWDVGEQAWLLHEI